MKSQAWGSGWASGAGDSLAPKVRRLLPAQCGALCPVSPALCLTESSRQVLIPCALDLLDSMKQEIWGSSFPPKRVYGLSDQLHLWYLPRAFYMEGGDSRERLPENRTVPGPSVSARVTDSQPLQCWLPSLPVMGPASSRPPLSDSTLAAPASCCSVSLVTTRTSVAVHGRSHSAPGVCFIGNTQFRFSLLSGDLGRL